jgi:DNA-binding NarL/FixJ family response regulator
MEDFDVEAAITRAKRINKLRKPYSSHLERQSKLSPYQYEIFQMHSAGASLSTICTHLSITHNMTVHRTSVWRFIQKIIAEE